MVHDFRVSEIVGRIERSALSPKKYIQCYNVPFSIAQFYRYRAQLSEKGKEGLRDRRKEGRNRKMGREETAFVRGFVRGRTEVSPTEVMQAMADESGTEVRRSTISRMLGKLGVAAKTGAEVGKKEQVSCAGFGLISALAVHPDWPAYTARRVADVIGRRRTGPQPAMTEKLEMALAKLNALSPHTLSGKHYYLFLSFIINYHLYATISCIPESHVILHQLIFHAESSDKYACVRACELFEPQTCILKSLIGDFEQ